MRLLHRRALVPAISLAVAVSTVLASGTAEAAATTPGSAATGQAPAITPLQAAVRQVVLQNRDLFNHFTVKLFKNGDDAKKEITLDNCGFRFTSEKFRVARRQVSVRFPDGSATGISNEVVAYNTVAHAQLALREWRTSVARCKLNTDTTSPLYPGSKLRFTAERTRADGHLPVRPAEVTTFAYTLSPSGRKVYALGVLQLRGQILDIMWFVSGTPLTNSLVTAVRGYATLTGRKLAKR